jgi:hypothetical protein
VKHRGAMTQMPAPTEAALACMAVASNCKACWKAIGII